MMATNSAGGDGQIHIAEGADYVVAEDVVLGETRHLDKRVGHGD